MPADEFTLNLKANVRYRTDGLAQVLYQHRATPC
jgi:hypothetical protein